MKQLELNYENAKTIREETAVKANAARIALREKFQSVLEKFFVEDDCFMSCADVSISYRDTSKVDFRCDIGFRNPEKPDRMDFGSSFWFHFEDGNMKINAGTIGDYKLTDIYQLKRNNTIYHLTCINGVELEKQLNAIDCSDYIEATNEDWKAARAVVDAEKALEAAKRKAVSETIIVNKVYKHSSECTNVGICFYNPCYFTFKTDLIKIIKVTNKFVEVEISNADAERYPGIRHEKVRKAGLIDDILAERIVEVA